MVFEAFELLPTNSAAMKNSGRLVRSFPGSAVVVDNSHFDKTEFQGCLSQMLSTMSKQECSGTRPLVSKTGKLQEETRDTVHPKMVSELLMNVLRAVGKPTKVPTLWKNTREEVLWHNSLLPWHRSATWLMIRVVLQLKLLAIPGLYKSWMINVLVQIIKMALEQQADSGTLFCMRAKLSQRLMKLDDASQTDSYLDTKDIQDVLAKVDLVLTTRSEQMTAKASPRINLSELGLLDFRKDVRFHLPMLDNFLKTRNAVHTATNVADFQPEPHHLDPLDPVKLPKVVESSGFALLAVELWVEQNLSVWVDEKKQNEGCCSSILLLMKQYHSAASTAYARNPEAYALMCLILLELWVACDRCACSQHSILLQYPPEIPLKICDWLLLPDLCQMQRLQEVELYMQMRSTQSTKPSVFTSFGHSESFAVKYFQNSSHLRTILQEIEQEATSQKVEKINEFNRKQTQYEGWMQQSRQSSCECIYSWTKKGRKVRSRFCEHCSCFQRASNLKIDLHEWPLPDKVHHKQNVVFELDAPVSFAGWREATVFLICDVLGSSYSGSKPVSKHTLNSYRPLLKFLSTKHGCRTQLLSETKPHAGTHRKEIAISNAKLDDICMPNGLRLQYFDVEADCFTSLFTHQEHADARFSYKFSKTRSSLQKYLDPQLNHTAANRILADQNLCPLDYSIDEYRALFSIPAGRKLRWLNILTQLAAPTIDLGKTETLFVLLQSAMQTGATSSCANLLRENHLIFKNGIFSTRLIRYIHSSLDQMERNHECSRSLTILTRLASRILSLSQPEIVVSEVVSFLARAREVAYVWLNKLRDKNLNLNISDSRRSSLNESISDAALTMASSFQVEKKYLGMVFDGKTTTRYFQALLVVHEASSSRKQDSDTFKAIHLNRLVEFAFRSRSMISKLISCHYSASLDAAISWNWPSYRSDQPWNSFSHPREHWMSTFTTRNGGRKGLPVHFNFVTGEMLVNGLPMARLPSNYEGHEDYSRLFGSSCLEIMPSPEMGMALSTKYPWERHMLHFNLQDIRLEASVLHNTLLISAIKEDHQYDLVPRVVFGVGFPHSFIENHAHWYCAVTDTVQFRPLSYAWTETDHTWQLKRSGKRWELSKKENFLINLSSTTGIIVSGILNKLESSTWSHLIFNEPNNRLDIDLPVLDIGFCLESGSNVLRSREYRDYFLDDNQQVGALTGFRNQLVLKSDRSGAERLLILTSGLVSYSSMGEMVIVNVAQQSARKVHVLHVDNHLGYLKDDGTIHSKLFLAYIHAITSFCIPDALTGKTGTEQAITILRSAALRSFNVLDDLSFQMLKSIVALVAKRKYYPSELSVMQTVTWDSRLSYLSQTPILYDEVNKIMSQARDTAFLYPSNNIKIPDLDKPNRVLSTRDKVRNSTFRKSKFGAEEFSIAYDQLYIPRDRGQESSNGNLACIAANSIMLEKISVQSQIPQYFSTELWSRFEDQVAIPGPRHLPLVDKDLDYDRRWLQDSMKALSKVWCRLHSTISKWPDRFSKHKVMFWLATVAFNSDLNMIQVIIAMFNNKSTRISIPPDAEDFKLSMGASVWQDCVKPLILPCAREFEQCPESKLPNEPDEDPNYAYYRKNNLYEEEKARVLALFADDIISQWPTEDLRVPQGNTFTRYLRTGDAIAYVQVSWREWVKNLKFKEYLSSLVGTVAAQATIPISFPYFEQSIHTVASASLKRHITTEDLLAGTRDVPRRCAPPDIADQLVRCGHASDSNDRLQLLIERLDKKASSKYQVDYVTDLKNSFSALANLQEGVWTVEPSIELQAILNKYLTDCREYAIQVYNDLETSILECLRARYLAAGCKHYPMITTSLLLTQISHRHRSQLSAQWKSAIVHYGISITQLQRAGRLLNLAGNTTDLVQELRNDGHKNWNPEELPDSLLIEIESGFLVRSVQEDIAVEMRYPCNNVNSVIQMPMGAGKTFTIVPITAASVADRSCLVRVVVSKPQAKQMGSVLVSRLGGIVDRRIYRAPISRSIKMNIETAAALRVLFQECMDSGGILLVQPEHLLSFKLMGLETEVNGDHNLADSLLSTEQFLKRNSRDIVDESDEVFDVKFELIYSMGSQNAIEASPERWIIIHEVLRLLAYRAAPEIKKRFPDSLEICTVEAGRFPRIRLLNSDASIPLVLCLGEEICKTGLPGLPIAHQSEVTRSAVLKYITSPCLNDEEVACVETNSTIWTESTKNQLLLLRGLLACGIFTFALSRKRWRVNYGLDGIRTPSTALAVPFRAKDQPTLRSEFSHPDVVLVLTFLSYYYEGLDDEKLYMSFQHLLKSDQASPEYEEWVRSSLNLPTAFKSLRGVNIKDSDQCQKQLFPHLRYSKGVIDYFLSHIVFPKQMKEFSHKLSASGWDIGEEKTFATTGFSGTIDSRHLLPLTVLYVDLPAQKHSDCSVLGHLLRPENTVEQLPCLSDNYFSDVEQVLRMVAILDPPTQVILDVGAQITDFDNPTFAQKWLTGCVDQSIKAIIFVNNDDDLSVMDRRGKTEPYRSSHYVTHPEECLVYLDEAHTRGIDIQLPTCYRALVTLGPGVTKDRLVQACMRMRKLGRGQSVVFCINREIENKIRFLMNKSLDSDILVTDVLEWVISETVLEFERCMPMWAAQGLRYEHQKGLRIKPAAAGLGGIEGAIGHEEALGFLEREARNLQALYGSANSESSSGLDCDVSANHTTEAIRQRCLDFDVTTFQTVSFQGEQERELSPEIQQERHVERPHPAQPHEHRLHDLVRSFATTGILSDRVVPEGAMMNFSQCLFATTAQEYLQENIFSSKLYVTADFARTIKNRTGSIVDSSQRTVQWILTARGSSLSFRVAVMVVISPFEAETLLPKITKTEQVTLHQYSIRHSTTYQPLDKLDLFTHGASWNPSMLPDSMRIQLNLFAGQLYFTGHSDYAAFCNYLGIAYEPPAKDLNVDADGFFLPPRGTGPFDRSPITFCKIMFMKIRRHGQQADKTHVGKVLNGLLLTASDFR